MDEDAFLKQVKKTIEKYELLKEGYSVVVGISGGADSVCLLRVLKELQGDLRLSITAVHVNHGLRGTEASEDESFVQKLCEDWSVDFHVFHEDIKSLSEEKSVSVEEAGRIRRYEIFDQVMSETGANAIAVAHHHDDQAETVMLNILRGSGIDGLCGMKPKQGAIIRPLLEVGRDQITSYLHESGISYRTDSSNLSLDYTRNRVRNKLFPLIQADFSIDPVKALLRLSMHANEDADYLDTQAKTAFDDICMSQQPDRIELSAEKFKELHGALRKRIIRLSWERLRNSRKNLESVHVESVLEILDCSTGKKTPLPGGFEALRSYDKLVIYKKQKAKKESFNYNVALSGETYIKEANGVLKAECLDGPAAFHKYGSPEVIKQSSMLQIFDFSKVESGINIRSRMDGDRIRPYRGNGEKKLKEFFIDEKIPSDNRDRIPLIAMENEIVWIIGMRTSEKYIARSDAEMVLVLTWQDL